MYKMINKLILLALCGLCYVGEYHGIYAVVPVLAAVTVSALCSYQERDALILSVYVLWCIAATMYLPLLFFVPLLCYDLAGRRYQWAAAAALIPAVYALPLLHVQPGVYLAIFMALAWVLQARTTHLERSRRETLELRDATKEFALQLEHKNKELLDKQDYELNLAVLGERNRIAREIHDSVGHTLSNAILQTGALMALNHEEAMKPRLETLRDTLKSGMDSIRASLHDLHEESIDLHVEVRNLVAGFLFCPITLDDGIEGNPERNVKYTLLAILKEALANVIRHSNATQVRVALREHPALYQLIVSDNGSGTKPGAAGEGIGLKNIAQRVEALGGILTITREGGFTVFVSLPKERTSV